MSINDTGPAPKELRGLARATTLNLAGSAVSAVTILALLLILTKGLGQGRAGAFLSAIALFQVLSIAAALGVETGLVKWISGRADISSPLPHAELMRIALVPVLIVSILATFATIALSPDLGHFIGGASLGEETTTVIATMTLFLPAASLSYALLGATRGFGTMRPTVILDRLGRSLAQILGVAVAVAVGTTPTIIALVWGIPYLAQLLLSWIWLERLHRADRLEITAKSDWRSAATEFWRFTLPRAVASIFRATFQWFDVILVAGLASPEDAAVYAVATRLLQVGLLAAFSVGQAVEPRFGKAVASGDDATTRYLYEMSTAWLILITWPIYIVLALYSGSFLGIFGTGYVVGASAVVVLSGAVMFGAAVGPVDVLLVMKGKSTWSLWNTSLALGLNIGLNLLLIPTVGILGAAISLAISRFAANFLPLVQLFHMARLHPFGHVWIRAATTSAVTFGLIGIGLKTLFGASLPIAITAGVVGVALYLPLIWRSRGLLGLSYKLAAPTVSVNE